LVDSDVLIDFLIDREPFTKDVHAIEDYVYSKIPAILPENLLRKLGT